MPTDSVTFFVPGKPATKGSSYSFRSASTGKQVHKPANERLKGWTQFLQLRFREAASKAGGWTLVPLGRRVGVSILIRAKRPKKSKYDLPFGPPDVDKVARAVLDALTGVAYADDRQVWPLVVSRNWGPADETCIRLLWGPTWTYCFTEQVA